MWFNCCQLVNLSILDLIWFRLCSSDSLWLDLISLNVAWPLSKCRQRNYRRNYLVLKGSSKPCIWVLRVLICGPGALRACLSKCTKRNHRRNDLVLKGSSKPNIWVLRALTCGPGAFRLCLSKCSKRNRRRNDLVLKGSSEPCIWVLRVLICGPGALRFAF